MNYWQKQRNNEREEAVKFSKENEEKSAKNRERRRGKKKEKLNKKVHTNKQ